MTSAEIAALLDRFDHLQLECDGFTRIASHALWAHGVQHETLQGFVETPAGDVELHFWIRVGALTVDYRLRMWTDATMPHGVFVAPASVRYVGRPIGMMCSTSLFEMLTNGMKP